MSNPEFLDADGDGVSDRREVDKFILQKFQDKNCISLIFPRNDKSRVEGMISTIFYVPKGTEAFVVKTQDTVPITFLAADGTHIEEVTSQSDAECLVRVPKGRDGAVWELRTPGAQAITLSGVPPWLATTPDRLLIPKEAEE